MIPVLENVNLSSTMNVQALCQLRLCQQVFGLKWNKIPVPTQFQRSRDPGINFGEASPQPLIFRGVT